MWDFFLKNTRFSYLLIFALIGLGLYSIASIPRESAPEVQVPVGIVTTVLPGAPAIDIETLVTNEIERGLAGNLTDVKKITSRSSEGVSSITVEFEADADIDASIQDLKDQVDTITPELPTDAEDPRVTEVDFVDQPILTFAISGPLSDSDFTALADSLEDELESIPGVSQATASGVRDPEVSVLVEETALARYGLTITDITTAIASANNTFPIGNIITDDVAYNIVFAGDIATPAEVADIPITALEGQPVYVRDVATVSVGLAETSTISRLSVDGAPSERAITFDIYKQRGGDITALTASVQDRLDELQADGQLLAGLTVYSILDAGKDINDDLLQLSGSGLQTIILVVLVLIVAIGWREGLIAGTAIPLSFLIGFIGLYLSGNTINFISLFALILGIGVLVDSGLVMIEGINRRMKVDPSIDKVEAARLTVKEFASPLVAGTLTTVSMFVGLFVVSGVTGQFISAIPFTLIFVLFASLLVALGFLPLIAAGFLRRRSQTWLEQKQVEYSNRLEGWYREKLLWVLTSKARKRRFITLLVTGLITAILLIPAGLVQVIFFEETDAGFLVVEAELPESSIKESTDITIRRIEEVLYTYPDEIEAFSSTVGAGNAFGSGGQGEKLGNIFITLRDDRSVTSFEFAEILRQDLSSIRDADVTVSQPAGGPPTGSPIGIKLTGSDLQELTTYTNQIAQLLSTIEGTTNVTTSANTNSTEIVLTLDKAKTAAVGLNPQVVSQTLRSAVFGSTATSLTSLTDDTDVVVRLNLAGSSNNEASEANRTTLNALEGIQLSTPSGDTILLSSLVTSSLQESSSVINHEDQERVMTVSADTTPSGNVREINAIILDKIDSELDIPESITISLGGETEESDQAFQELFLALIVGITLMVAVLVLQFDSFRHTLYVLSILPFSLIGILYGLALIGSALSFTSIMGFIALSGIVVNNSILLIDQMNNRRKESPDTAILTVVVESAVSRLRPILLTSTTTIIGMIPLLFTDPLWVPLATAIMFGLAFSVLITLVLIPVIYLKYPGTVRR